MNDEQFFLANAYVDGELTDDERRIAEADPDVMSAAEELGALRAELRAVEPPSSAARESAIASAMSEFDARDTPESGSWAPIPLRPRPSYAKYLGVAAAVVAVVGLGVVVSQAGRGGGDDDAADTAAIESAAEPVDGDADAAFIESAPARSSESASEFNDEVSGEIANDQGEEAPEENSADGQADEPTVDTVRSAVPPDFDADAPIADDGELGIYGAYLLNQRDSGELGATPEYNCPAQSYPFLDEAIFMFDGDERPVYVAVDEAGGFVFAIDVDTCDALAVGSLTDP